MTLSRSNLTSTIAIASWRAGLNNRTEMRKCQKPSYLITLIYEPFDNHRGTATRHLGQWNIPLEIPNSARIT